VSYYSTVPVQVNGLHDVLAISGGVDAGYALVGSR